MSEIICPHCKKTFKVDEAGYADILKQVRDHQFEEELKNRLAIAEREKQNAVTLAEEKTKNALQEKLAEKDMELAELKALKESELSKKIAEKDTELLQVKSKLEKAETEKKLALKEAIQEIEKEREQLKNDLKTKELEKQNIENSLKQQFTNELQNKDAIIKYKDDEIARVKDMKQKLSTKMVGQTLEQHCEIEFNKLRPTAFQKAYFEKDNDASGSTKGDYIYKETDDQGNELISIMFEMKTRMTGLQAKRKMKFSLPNLITTEKPKIVSMLY
jgi:hypothetical protein